MPAPIPVLCGSTGKVCYENQGPHHNVCTPPPPPPTPPSVHSLTGSVASCRPYFSPHNKHGVAAPPLSLSCQEAERAIVKASAEKERRRSSAAAAAAWVPKVLTPNKGPDSNGVANGDSMKTPVKGWVLGDGKLCSERLGRFLAEDKGGRQTVCAEQYHTSFIQAIKRWVHQLSCKTGIFHVWLFFLPAFFFVRKPFQSLGFCYFTQLLHATCV